MYIYKYIEAVTLRGKRMLSIGASPEATCMRKLVCAS